MERPSSQFKFLPQRLRLPKISKAAQQQFPQEIKRGRPRVWRLFGQDTGERNAVTGRRNLLYRAPTWRADGQIEASDSLDTGAQIRREGNQTDVDRRDWFIGVIRGHP